jgi:hypothetical protein
MNYEHIKTCFDSIYSADVDYYVLENKSKNSEQIAEYFLSRPIKGYLQFEENIADNAMKVFLAENESLLRQYKYVTLSDCDLQVDNIQNTWQEIRKILELPRIGICAIDLKLDNFPHDVAKPGDWLPSHIAETPDYIEVNTGGHLMSMKSENLDIVLKSRKAVDVCFREIVIWLKLKWVKTKINKAKHLTWDYYHVGTEYYNFRIANPHIFNQNRTCPYKRLL